MIENTRTSICDDCLNEKICKFTEDVQRAELKYEQMRNVHNFPECIVSHLDCSYRQYISKRGTVFLD